MSWFASAEARRSARLLEFPELLDEVARHCALAPAADAVRATEPIADSHALERLWNEVDEIGLWLREGEDLALGDMLDLAAALGSDRRARGPLDGGELAAVGAAAAALSTLRDHLLNHRDRLPLAAARVESGADHSALAAHFRAALEPDGRIRDDASPALASLRREARAAESRWRDSAQRSLADAQRRGVASGGELVLRGDRFCIAVPAEKRRQLPGIVHDRSGSGQTVFIEALDVVEHGNEFTEARLAVAEEERRVLERLNYQLAARVPELLASHGEAVVLDALRARARYGREVHGQRPRFVGADEGLRLSGFAHPGLRRSLPPAQLVPLTVELLGDRRLLLVTGPNAGGKTVCMKAVGLAALMAQSGIPLPAQLEPQLPIFARVLIEAGDDQSIENALSSFSAHLTHVREILNASDPKSLLLLDELGSGTDPREGVAIARAVIERVAAQGAFAIISTHYGELKALAQELPPLRNASMAYDAERLRPRFDLVLDRPGASHALEIAQRLELPEALIERARELVGAEHLRYDAMLSELERERDGAAIARAEAARLRDEAARRQRDYDERITELRRGRRRQLGDAQREAEAILRNARATVERLVERVRRAKDFEEAKARAQEARERLDEAASRMAAQHARQRRAGRTLAVEDIEPGQRLRHRALGVVATVIEVRGDRVTLDLGGRRLLAGAAELLLPEQPLEDALPPATTHRRDVVAEQPASRELDVRGLDAVDAWQAVDKAIDRCILENLHQLTVIHGKGQGVLRRELSRQLASDPRVRRAAVGGDGEFDDGVTLVEL